MAGFEMCAACRSEYDDPLDRRFHAQPNACPACGPCVRLADAAGVPVEIGPARDPIAATADALAAGQIVAVKGLGGFHLACRADDDAAVAALRARKHREDKPFALMAPDLAVARSLVELEPAEEQLLLGRERPIVLAARRPGAPVADAVAPGMRELGVMLPYSPLHHLLLADSGCPLVLTSGNVSDEPIAYLDDDALARLAHIADLFLLHDRPIHMRTDDSVVRAVRIRGRRQPAVVRRSRGYVPSSVVVPFESPRPVLACGAELKNTFCLVKGSRAWIGHHIGDLENYETLTSFREGIRHFERLFAVEPEIVAHDLHPDYLSTGYAFEREGVELVGVQHHHAHLAACLAEHGEEGTGCRRDLRRHGLRHRRDDLGWGAARGGLTDFERVGHLWPVPLPGGERAIREPWRMACSWLVTAQGDEPSLPSTLSGRVDPSRWRAVASLARLGVAAPVTTSAGRLFDAVAALCGLRAEVRYEGQAAIELEACAAPPEVEGSYPFPVRRDPRFPGALLLDARETILAVLADVVEGVAPALVARRFHSALAVATAGACDQIARARGLELVVLSGGVFQNRTLLEQTVALLEEEGLRALVPERLPANDGGISFGQAAVAAAGVHG